MSRFGQLRVADLVQFFLFTFGLDERLAVLDVLFFHLAKDEFYPGFQFAEGSLDGDGDVVGGGDGGGHRGGGGQTVFGNLADEERRVVGAFQLLGLEPAQDEVGLGRDRRRKGGEGYPEDFFNLFLDRVQDLNLIGHWRSPLESR